MNSAVAGSPSESVDSFEKYSSVECDHLTREGSDSEGHGRVYVFGI
jgi:hypothetical protein